MDTMSIQEIKDRCERNAKGKASFISSSFAQPAARALKLAIEALETTRDIFPKDSGTAFAMQDRLEAIRKEFE